MVRPSGTQFALAGQVCSVYVLVMPETHGLPTAATKLGDCAGYLLRMVCSRCGRPSALSCGDLATTVGREVSLWCVVEKLRCRQCDATPATVELVTASNTARSGR